MFEIIPNLWLGSYKQASEHTAASKVSCYIVNCTKDLPMSGTGIRLEVDDNGTKESSVTMLLKFSEVTLAIHNALQQGTPVLVHCLAGQQRSPAVVCAYLMEYQGFSLEESISFIREKKRDAFFWQVNFREALERYAIILGKPPVMLR